MKMDTLEQIMKKAMDYAQDECVIGYQGGEPTLAGLDFYRDAVRLQEQYNTRNLVIHNTIQTNGYRLDREWFPFLAEKGFFPVEDLTTLRKTGSYLQGHPDMKHIPGVDMSSGSLGQGISAAVGMALAGKMDNSDYRVYAMLGDGEIEEGQVWEAAMFAGHRKLDNMVFIVDNNNLQIDGTVEDVCSPYPIDEKFKAFNFHVVTINGHDFDQIRSALNEAKETKGMPTAIVMNTVKGKGVSFMENKVNWHGAAPNDEQYKVAMEDLEKVGEALCQK